MIKRRKTRTVKIGNVNVGSKYPISIQSMAKTETSDVHSTTLQIQELESIGCEIVRVAVKTVYDTMAVAAIKSEVNIPVVADIHYDYKLALGSIKYGIDKIRINPGNISKREEVEKVIDAASEKGIPIRVGVNSGSLMQMANNKGDSVDAMVDSTLKYLEIFQKKNFNDIIISLKSSDVPSTVEAYKRMAPKCDYPFHVGVTAAGSPDKGIVKSSIGIGALLLDGIGDTIRVSLTGEPFKEIDAARRILEATDIRYFSPDIISCPTCGRCRVDLEKIVSLLTERLAGETDLIFSGKKEALSIAVMGCEVNGPGEAKEADVGIAFGNNRGALFKHGEIIKTVDASEAVDELIKLIRELEGK